MLVCRECGNPRVGADRTCEVCGCEGWISHELYEGDGPPKAAEWPEPSGPPEAPAGEATISVRCTQMKLFGPKAQADVLIDGEKAGKIRLRETATFKARPGYHAVQVVLGPVKSNMEVVQLADGDEARLEYRDNSRHRSWVWGLVGLTAVGFVQGAHGAGMVWAYALLLVLCVYVPIFALLAKLDLLDFMYRSNAKLSPVGKAPEEPELDES